MNTYFHRYFVLSLALLFLGSCGNDDGGVTLERIDQGLPDIDYSVDLERLETDTLLLDQSTSVNLKVNYDEVEGLIPASYRFIEGGGAVLIDGDTLSQGHEFALNELHTLTFTATQVGRNVLELSTDNGKGRVKTVAVSFHVISHIPVPFELSIPTKDFSVKVDEGFQFTLNLASSDLDNQMEYTLDYELPFPNASKVQVIDDGDATLFEPGDLFSAGSASKVMNVTFQDGHPVGSAYQMPLQVTDKNGDFRRDTVTFSLTAQSVDYTLDVSPKTFEVKVNEGFRFTIDLTSSDLDNGVKYNLQYQLPFPNASKVQLIDQDQNALTIEPGDLFSIGSATKDIQVTFQDGHPVGENYTMPLTMIDENGDVRNEEITFTLNAASVDFLIEVAPTSFPKVAPSESFDFTITLESADLTNQIKYFLDYTVSNPSSTSVSANETSIASGGQIAQGSATVSVGMQFNNHPGGTYVAEFIVRDENGDTKDFEITYTIVENQPPEATNLQGSLNYSPFSATESTFTQCDQEWVCSVDGCDEGRELKRFYFINKTTDKIFLDVTFVPQDDSQTTDGQIRFLNSDFPSKNFSVTNGVNTVRTEVGYKYDRVCRGQVESTHEVIEEYGQVEIRLRDDEGLWSTWQRVSI